AVAASAAGAARAVDRVRPPRGRPPGRRRGPADELALVDAALSSALAVDPPPVTTLPGRLADALGVERGLWAARRSPARAWVPLPVVAPELRAVAPAPPAVAPEPRAVAPEPRAVAPEGPPVAPEP